MCVQVLADNAVLTLLYCSQGMLYWCKTDVSTSHLQVTCSCEHHVHTHASTLHEGFCMAHLALPAKQAAALSYRKRSINLATSATAFHVYAAMSVNRAEQGERCDFHRDGKSIHVCAQSNARRLSCAKSGNNAMLGIWVLARDMQSFQLLPAWFGNNPVLQFS